jgi:hypothetical protein
MVRDTLPYGHAPTYQIYLTYLERQKSYGPDKLCWEEAEEAKAEGKAEVEEKIRLKQYVSLRSKGRHNKLPLQEYNTMKNFWQACLPVWHKECIFQTNIL